MTDAEKIRRLERIVEMQSSALVHLWITVSRMQMEIRTTDLRDNKEFRQSADESLEKTYQGLIALYDQLEADRKDG